MKYVWVVTSVEMGWDCVCAVYDNEEAALEHAGDDRTYVVHEKRLESVCDIDW